MWRCKQMAMGTATMVAAMVVSSSSSAQTTLIDEDFQTPLLSSGTANPGFAGWTWMSGGTGVKSRRSDVVSDVPCDNYPTETNQVIQLEQENLSGQGYYDTTHFWDTNEAFTLTIKASPQSWNGSADRYIQPSIRQTDGTVLWAANDLMPHYDNFGRNPWTAAQTFTWVVWTDQFTAGTTGEQIRFYLDHGGQRGIFVDDIFLEVGPPPTDSTKPSPDPPTWEIEPVVADYGYITMKVTNVTDTAGVEYLFTNTVRGTSSGWQDGRTWNEGGLEHNTLYTYQVKARDKSPSKNETSFSSAKSTTTWAVPAGTLVITGFQCPAFSDGYAVQNDDFLGWDAYSNPRTRNGGNNGVPADSDYPSPNRAIQFEYTDDYVQYNVSHNWAASDVYILTVNAAPQATWNYDKQRYVRPSIREQDGTVLWAPGENMSGPEKTSMPVNIDFDSSTWQAEPDLNFSFTINASDFVGLPGASEGQPLAVRIASSGVARGVHVDNVHLIRVIPPGGTLFRFY